MGKKRIYSVKKRPFVWPRPKAESKRSFSRGFSPDITDRKSSISRTGLFLKSKSCKTQESAGVFGPEVIVASVTPQVMYSNGGFSPDITCRQSRRAARRALASSESSDFEDESMCDGNLEEQGVKPYAQTLKMIEEAGSTSCTETVERGNTADVSDMENIVVKCEENDSVIGWSSSATVMETALVLNKESYNTQESERVCTQEVMMASVKPHFSGWSTGFSPDITDKPNRPAGRPLASPENSDLREPVSGDGNHEEQDAQPNTQFLKISDEAGCVETFESSDMETDVHVTPQFRNGVDTAWPQSMLILFQGDALLVSGVLSDSESEVKILPQEPEMLSLENDNERKGSGPSSVITECLDSSGNSHWRIPPPEPFDDFSSSSAVPATDDDSNLQHFSPQHSVLYKNFPLGTCSLVVPEDADALASDESLISQELEETLTVMAIYDSDKSALNALSCNTHLTEPSILVSEMEELVPTQEASPAMLPTDSECANNDCDYHENPEREEDTRAGQEIMKAELSKANSLRSLKRHKKLYHEEHRSIVYGDKQFVVCRTDLRRVRNRVRDIPLWRIHRKEKLLRKYEPITIDERDCHRGVNVLRQMPSDEDYLVIKFQPVLVFMGIDTSKCAVCVVFEVYGSAPLLGYFPASECLFPDFVEMLTNIILVAVGEQSLDLSDSSDKISELVRELSDKECFSLLFPSDLMGMLKLYSSITEKKVTKKAMCITCGRLGINKPATSTIMAGGLLFNKTHQSSVPAQENCWKLCGPCVKHADAFQKLQQLKCWLLTAYHMQLKNLYARLDERQKYDINDVVQFLRGDNLHNRLLFYEFVTIYFTLIEAKKDIEALTDKAGKEVVGAYADLSRQSASTSNVESITKKLSQEAVEKCEDSKTEMCEMKTDDVFVFRAKERVSKRVIKKRQIYSPSRTPVKKVEQQTTVSTVLSTEESKSRQSYPKAAKIRRTLNKGGVLRGPVLPTEECAAHLDEKTGSARPAKRKATSKPKMPATRQRLAMNLDVPLNTVSQSEKTDTLRRRQFNSNESAKPDHNVTEDKSTRMNKVSFPVLTVRIPLERLSTDVISRLCGGSGASTHCTQKKSIRSKLRRR